jgi:hypothetical protein
MLFVPITVIRADLIGATIFIAAGITAIGNTPVLAICRQLVEAGHDPRRRLNVYRGDTLALTVRSIGVAAGLEINSKGTGFIAARAVRTALPMRKTGGAR